MTTYIHLTIRATGQRWLFCSRDLLTYEEVRCGKGHATRLRLRAGIEAIVRESCARIDWLLRVAANTFRLEELKHHA